MNWSDEKLSAFLDGELPATQAEALRDAIERDEALADRVAALAAADVVVRDTYRSLGDEPLPHPVQQLLTADNVQTLGRSRSRSSTTSWPRAAAAAGLALLVGLIAGQRWGAPQDEWPDIAAVLETRTSGEAYPVSDRTRVEPRLTYRNRNGDYCRYFVLTRENSREETLACRRNDTWQRVSTFYDEQAGQGGLYRAASGGSPLDPVIDRTLDEGPLDLESEQTAIRRDWGG